MSLYLADNNKTPIHFETDTSAVLAYPALTGARVVAYRTDSLDLMVKELITELYSIRYNVFRFFKSQAIESVSRKRGLHSRVMLQNDLHFSIDDVGHFHQREDTVTMFWSEAASCKALFEGGKEYKALDIFIHPDIVQQLAFFFPDLPIDPKAETTTSLFQGPVFVTPALREIVNEILNCPYDEQTSRFYYDLKVREYLYLVLEEQLHRKKSRYHFTPHETEQIISAREMLLSDLGKPPLTIRELARKAAINEFKLKAGFRQFFKVSIFQCFQQARMQRAKDLLLQTNKGLKEICVMAGYSRMTNFITAFRKHFGYTPASLRRK